MYDKNSEDKRNYIIGLVYVLVFYGAVHFLIAPNFGDDDNFRKMLLKKDNHIFELIGRRYFTWTSRLWIDFNMFLFCRLPVFLWKMIDLLCLGVLYVFLAKYTTKYIIVAGGLCAYPFMYMASAGWIATTVNYLWPFTAGVVAFYLLHQMCMKTQKAWKYMVYFLLVLFLSCSELMVIMFTMGVGLYLFEDHKQIRERKMYAVFTGTFGILIAGILNMLLCPGNHIRTLKEIRRWMPEFNDLSFLAKFRICAVSTLQHYTSIPNVIFFLFNALLIYSVWRFVKQKRILVLSCIPMFINTTFTVYYGYTEILRKNNLNYVLPDTVIHSGTKGFWQQMIMLVMSVVYLICVMVCIYHIFAGSDNDKAHGLRYMILYFAGILSRFTLIFSPTMLASSTRVYFIQYMTMIWIMVKLCEKEQGKIVKYSCHFLLALGALINVIMVIFMQRLYGAH